MGYKIITLALILAIGFSSCQQSVTPSELVSYVRKGKNGLHKTKTIGSLSLDLQYRPVDYVIANEFRSNTIDSEAYQQRKNELGDLQYYNLKLGFTGNEEMDITKYNVTTDQELQERLYYLSFHLKNDIRLIQGTDTLAPVLYHFERSFDLSNHRTFVLAFEETDKTYDNDKTFYMDTPILETGPLKIKIDKKSIKNVPNLNI